MHKVLVERFKVEGLTLQIEAAKFIQVFLKTQRNQTRALDDIIANIPKNSRMKPLYFQSRYSVWSKFG